MISPVKSLAFIEEHYSHVTTPEIAARIVRMPKDDGALREILDW